MLRRSHRAKGYALPTVLGILALIAISLSVLLSVISNTARTSGDMLKRRKSFYACDGMQRAIISLGNNYLRSTDSPDPSDMKTSIESQAGGAGLPNIMESGYTLTNFDVDFDPNDVTTGPLPSGPFIGMNARQTPIKMDLEAQLSGTPIKCGQSVEVSLAQIGLFQFLVFSDLNTRLSAGTASFFNGRAHINGDICLEGFGEGAANTGTLDQGPYMSQVTAGGRVLHAADTRCEARTGQGSNVAIVDGDPATGTWFELRDDGDNGCTNCGGGSLNWRQYALDRWNGRVQDSEHDVPNLRLPIASAAGAQAGYNARISPNGVNTDFTQSNDGTARFLIDPPQSSDSFEVRSARLACKADLRIIDGIWYKRPSSPADGCGWPGTPIWSDHVGTYNDFNGTAVGQLDLNTSVGWGGVSPQRYSYYERTDYVANSHVGNNASGGVISYGTVGSNDPAGNTRVYEPASHATTAEHQACNGTSAAFTPLSDNTNASATEECRSYTLIEGTTGGFLNSHAHAHGHTAQQEILPINFDVAEFQNALADGTNNELGTHFPGGTFNGIVYITATWPDSHTGFPNGHAGAPPQQGTGGVKSVIPEPLCSNTNEALADLTGLGGAVLTAPNCEVCPPSDLSSETCTQGRGRPNALRIINGRNINFNLGVPAIAPNQLNDGLSIVTNLPYYVLGDFNAGSQARTPTSTQWVSVGVWGDAGHFLSNAWSDDASNWTVDVSTEAELANRCAVDTVYNLGIFTGNAISENGTREGGIHNLPRFLEAWRNSGTITCTGAPLTAQVTGSFVVGHAPVYARYGFASPSTDSYQLPVRDWQFDEHFARIDNQPPGTPVFDVSAMRRWSRF